MRILIATGIPQLNQAITRKCEERGRIIVANSKEWMFQNLEERDFDVIILGEALKGDISDPLFWRAINELSSSIKFIYIAEDVSFEDKTKLYQHGIFHVLAGEINLTDLEHMVFEE